MLSYAVRHLGCIAGVVITASHTVSSCRRAAFTPGGALGAAADRRAESAG